MTVFLRPTAIEESVIIIVVSSTVSQSACFGYKDKVLILQPVYSFKLFCISWARRAHAFVCHCQKVAAICWNYLFANSEATKLFINIQSFNPNQNIPSMLHSLPLYLDWEQAKPHGRHTHNSSANRPVLLVFGQVDKVCAAMKPVHGLSFVDELLIW